MSRIFNEQEAATFLTEHLSLPVKASTLRTRRMSGDGPLFSRLFGRLVQYDEDDLREWVEQLRSRKVRSTAQEKRRHRATQIAAE